MTDDEKLWLNDSIEKFKSEEDQELDSHILNYDVIKRWIVGEEDNLESDTLKELATKQYKRPKIDYIDNNDCFISAKVPLKLKILFIIVSLWAVSVSILCILFFIKGV